MITLILYLLGPFIADWPSCASPLYGHARPVIELS
jgi:hypothetical protein